MSQIIPRVTEATIEGSTKTLDDDPDYLFNFYLRIKDENPILRKQIQDLCVRAGKDEAFGLLVLSATYTLIERQLESERLKKITK